VEERTERGRVGCTTKTKDGGERGRGEGVQSSLHIIASGLDVRDHCHG
jgi:hypothetical protein